MITGIGHTAYAAKDMEATLHFYCGQLGLQHAFSITDDNGAPWIEYVKVTDGQFLEFFYADKDYVPRQGNCKHLCLLVDDIHRQADALEKAGILLRVKPKQGKGGDWQCWADDPDGNAIEFMQIMPDSQQAKA